MLNRRKLFSFLATAPVATVIGAKAAMDANGNDVAPLMRGDFDFPHLAIHRSIDGGPWETIWMPSPFQQRPHNPRSQSLRS